MRARPLQSKSRPGPKGAGPFDSVAADRTAAGSDTVPSGWVRRDSGLIVPKNRGRRRGRAMVCLLGAVLLIAPVANVVSEVSRAGSDALTFIRLVFANETPPPTPTSSPHGCVDR